MAYKIQRVEVWVADLLNRPGTLARMLEALSAAGARLEFMVARRVTESSSRVFLAPIATPRQRRAARDVGLLPAKGMHSVRISGDDRPGLGAALTRAIAGKDINIRGASAAAVGRKVIFYFAFASDGDTKAAMSAARKCLNTRKR
ncbi:MAG: ACT domain-containing protein [Phycisphaerae bacterium]|nr:ACT domain-containing protein [Phycisphaerae bacterium]